MRLNHIFKIIFYLFMALVAIVFLVQIFIFIVNIFFGSKNINLKNDFVRKTQIICIFKDQNITIEDNNNYITQLNIDDSSMVNIQINKNKIRNIYINNTSVKLQTEFDSMRVLNSRIKKLGGWRGMKIKDVNLKHFFVNKNKEFTFKTYTIK